MKGYDAITTPRGAKSSLVVTKNEDGKVTALTLNMNGYPYRHYAPDVDWTISISFPATRPQFIRHTGMY